MKDKFLNNLRKNQNGQAIMQALLGALITGAVMLSTVSLLNQQKKTGTETQLVLKSVEIQKKLQEIIRDDRAWQNTVNNNASLSCLSTAGGNCAGASGTFILYDSAGAIFYDPATQGFDSTGAICTGFVAPPGAGNDRCPYQVELSWTAIEPNISPQTACTIARCDVAIVGTFTYNPGSNTKKLPFYQANYRVDFVRETKTSEHYIYVVDRKAANTAGGACTPGTWVQRTFNTILTDTGANVLSLPGTNSIQLAAGRYQCEISAPASGLEEHQARLEIPGGTPTRIVGTSSYYYTPSNIKGNFTITAATTVYVEHICRATASPASISFGAPVNLGTYEIYSTFRCKRYSQ